MTPVLLDTNLLLLFLVGGSDPARLQWKRLASFDHDDLVWLVKRVGKRPHVSLPNILTEASNLLHGRERETFAGASELLGAFAQRLSELYVPSRDAVRDPAYLRLGLTDAAICLMAQDNVEVMTEDHDLAGVLSGRRVRVTNIRHHRTPKRTR